MQPSNDNKPTDAELRELGAKGLFIEAGWKALSAAWLMPGTSPEMRDLIRSAFFGGGQHLFTLIVGAINLRKLSDGELAVLDLIRKETDAFIREYELKHLPTKGNG